MKIFMNNRPICSKLNEILLISKNEYKCSKYLQKLILDCKNDAEIMELHMINQKATIQNLRKQLNLK